MKKKYKLTILLTISLIILSCSVKLVSDYDQNTVDQVIRISKMINLIYMKIAETDSLTIKYENFSDDYKYIEVEIRSLVLLNKVRPYNKHSLSNTENLLKNWLEIKNFHENNDSYNFEVAVEDEEILQDQLLELVKKEQLKQ